MRLSLWIMLYCIAVVHIVVAKAHISLRNVAASNEADGRDEESTGYHIEHNSSEPMLIMSQTTNGITFSIHTKFLLVFMDIQTTVFLNYSIDCSTAEDNYYLHLDLSKENVAKVTMPRPVYITDVKKSCERFGSAEGVLNVTMSGILPGRTHLLIQVIPNTTEIFNSKSKNSDTVGQPYMYSADDGYVNNEQRWVVDINNTSNIPAKFLIVCLPKPSTLEIILRNFMMVYIVLVMATMGCKTELEILKQVLKKPVAPAIGMFCQFILMPLIAFTITRVITFPTAGMALGFFACGCSPGGGGSNLWAYLLHGDVSLSVAMTTVSSIAAIGTFPLWIFTLGRVVLTDQFNLTIPYLNIIISVLMVAIPLVIGVFLNYKKPIFTAKMLRFLIPFVIILTIVFIALSLYVNSYMFRLIKPILFLAGALLPCTGYLCGMGLSLLLKQSWCFCKTIAIETGIQNGSIAFIMVMFSFDPPDNVLAGTAPIAATSMTPIPLLVIAAIYHIYLRFCQKKPKAPSLTVTVEKEGLTGNDTEKEAMIEKISSL